MDIDFTKRTVTFSDEAASKVIELMTLFSDVSIESIKSMLSSDAGRLAYAILCSETDSTPVKILIDELLNSYISAETNKKFVTREVMLIELEDILKAKSITPYRRSRINKALKRACIECQGSGKKPRKIDTTTSRQRRERWEIDSHSPDCMHCKGTGINPKEVPVLGSTLFDLEQLEEKFITNALLSDEGLSATITPAVHDEQRIELKKDIEEEGN